MRFIVILALSIAFVSGALVSGSADARPAPIAKKYETDKRLGLGLMLGVPTGLGVKFMATDQLAIDLGVGAYIAYRDRTGLHINLDILYHPFVAIEGESFLAPFYAGLGGRFLSFDDNQHIGIRVPFGIAFDLSEKSIDVFLEGAFVFDVSRTDNTQGLVDVNVLTGLRFFVF